MTKMDQSAPSLILLYSWSGNTRAVAEMIKEATGSDIAEVTPAIPYPADLQACVDQVKDEVARRVMPPFSPVDVDLARYATVFLGSPCWWFTIAPHLATFIALHDFSGKTIAPFMTHEGSGLANSIKDIRRMCPDATIAEGLAIRGSSIAKSRESITRWVSSLGGNA